ncbi:MAG: hypothetical protein RR011_06400 [Oscillospiraceae bacterium]
MPIAAFAFFAPHYRLWFCRGLSRVYMWGLGGAKTAILQGFGAVDRHGIFGIMLVTSQSFYRKILKDTTALKGVKL